MSHDSRYPAFFPVAAPSHATTVLRKHASNTSLNKIPPHQFMTNPPVKPSPKTTQQEIKKSKSITSFFFSNAHENAKHARESATQTSPRDSLRSEQNTEESHATQKTGRVRSLSKSKLLRTPSTHALRKASSALTLKFGSASSKKTRSQTPDFPDPSSPIVPPVPKSSSVKVKRKPSFFRSNFNRFVHRNGPISHMFASQGGRSQDESFNSSFVMVSEQPESPQYLGNILDQYHTSPQPKQVNHNSVESPQPALSLILDSYTEAEKAIGSSPRYPVVKTPAEEADFSFASTSTTSSGQKWLKKLHLTPKSTNRRLRQTKQADIEELADSPLLNRIAKHQHALETPPSNVTPFDLGSHQRTASSGSSVPIRSSFHRRRNTRTIVPSSLDLPSVNAGSASEVERPTSPTLSISERVLKTKRSLQSLISPKQSSGFQDCYKATLPTVHDRPTSAGSEGVASTYSADPFARATPAFTRQSGINLSPPTSPTYSALLPPLTLSQPNSPRSPTFGYSGAQEDERPTSLALTFANSPSASVRSTSTKRSDGLPMPPSPQASIAITITDEDTMSSESHGSEFTSESARYSRYLVTHPERGAALSPKEVIDSSVSCLPTNIVKARGATSALANLINCFQEEEDTESLGGSTRSHLSYATRLQASPAKLIKITQPSPLRNIATQTATSESESGPEHDPELDTLINDILSFSLFTDRNSQRNSHISDRSSLAPPPEDDDDASSFEGEASTAANALLSRPEFSATQESFHSSLNSVYITKPSVNSSCSSIIEVNEGEIYDSRPSSFESSRSSSDFTRSSNDSAKWASLAVARPTCGDRMLEDVDEEVKLAPIMEGPPSPEVTDWRSSPGSVAPQEDLTTASSYAQSMGSPTPANGMKRSIGFGTTSAPVRPLKQFLLTKSKVEIENRRESIDSVLTGFDSLQGHTTSGESEVESRRTSIESERSYGTHSGSDENTNPIRLADQSNLSMLSFASVNSSPCPTRNHGKVPMLIGSRLPRAPRQLLPKLAINNLQSKATIPSKWVEEARSRTSPGKVKALKQTWENWSSASPISSNEQSAFLDSSPRYVRPLPSSIDDTTISKPRPLSSISLIGPQPPDTPPPSESDRSSLRSSIGSIITARSSLEIEQFKRPPLKRNSSRKHRRQISRTSVIQDIIIEETPSATVTPQKCEPAQASPIYLTFEQIAENLSLPIKRTIIRDTVTPQEEEKLMGEWYEFCRQATYEVERSRYMFPSSKRTSLYVDSPSPRKELSLSTATLSPSHEGCATTIHFLLDSQSRFKPLTPSSYPTGPETPELGFTGRQDRSNFSPILVSPPSPIVQMQINAPLSSKSPNLLSPMGKPVRANNRKSVFVKDFTAPSPPFLGARTLSQRRQNAFQAARRKLEGTGFPAEQTDHSDLSSSCNSMQSDVMETSGSANFVDNSLTLSQSKPRPLARSKGRAGGKKIVSMRV